MGRCGWTILTLLVPLKQLMCNGRGAIGEVDLKELDEEGAGGLLDTEPVRPLPELHVGTHSIGARRSKPIGDSAIRLRLPEGESRTRLGVRPSMS